MAEAGNNTDANDSTHPAADGAVATSSGGVGLISSKTNDAPETNAVESSSFVGSGLLSSSHPPPCPADAGCVLPPPPPAPAPLSSVSREERRKKRIQNAAAASSSEASATEGGTEKERSSSAGGGSGGRRRKSSQKRSSSLSVATKSSTDGPSSPFGGGGATPKLPGSVASSSGGGAPKSFSSAPKGGGGATKKNNVDDASSSGGGIDSHPFPRGSVIEVLHGSKNAGEEGSVDESESSSLSEGEEEVKEKKAKGTSVRLCDIIDRASTTRPADPNPALRWKYYVHYRDFNRRMDEWITTDRIVSPPSVGNAKVRAAEKRRKSEELSRERKKIEDEEGGNSGTGRKRRKRGSLGPPLEGAGTGVLEGGRRRRSAASSANVDDRADDGGEEEEGATQRLTRRQRKKAARSSSTAGDDADGASGTAATTGVVPVISPSSSTVASVATVPVTGGGAGDSRNTEQIGIDVVATIPAQELDEHEGLDEASLREHEEVTKVKNVAQVELGQYRMETWYFSPIPKELLRDGGVLDVLYTCEFSLNFFATKRELQRYQARELPKHRRHPPGNEIYRNGNLSMFEVDGFEERLYCQNLCYIAKLFLDHKTLYFDVDPFLFYVLCEVDNRGFHPVGYFSKEKYSDVGYNLACILTFPSHQRKGYGRFLISFSYELTKKEEKVGSPEKPMSDLGQQAYKPYWTSTIVDFLIHESDDAPSMSIMEISKRTSIMAEDIIFTLNQLGILKFINGVYFIAAEKTLLEQLAKKHPVKEPRVDATKLHWTPFVTEVKRDKFSIHSKKPSVEVEESRGNGGF